MKISTFTASTVFSQSDKPNGPGVGIAVPATQPGLPMRIQSGEYSPISGGEIKYVSTNNLSQLATEIWTETFCSDLISQSTIDNEIVRFAMGFENFPPGTVINDLDISIEIDPIHTWMGDVSIGFDAVSCGSPGTVAGCTSIIFDGDGGDGGATSACNASDDLGSITIDDASTTNNTADCNDDGIINNSTGNLPPAIAGALGIWEGTSPEDMVYWLNVADDAGGDSGVIEGWCMTMELEAPIPDCSASISTTDTPVCPTIVSHSNFNVGGSVTGGDLQIDYDWEVENTGMIDFGFPVDDFIGATIGAPNSAGLFSTGCDVDEYGTAQSGTESGDCPVTVPNPAIPECGVTEVILGGWISPSLDFNYTLPATYYIDDGAGVPMAVAVGGGASIFEASCTVSNANVPAITCPVDVHPQCIILPVELSDFESIVENGNLMLRWSTASEQNNAGFDVEISSAQLGGFETMGFVEGSGNSLTEQSYEFEVSDLIPGTYDIRLKQIDFDGAHEYSHVIEATLDVPGKYFLGQVYPNPFNPSASVEFGVPDRQTVRVSLHDLSGREVQTLFAGELESNEIRTAKIDGEELASGVYMVRISSSSFVGTRKLVLQK